ncbi:50S ribosomal protein L25/general stress protein Ctc [Tepidicaulis sp. LMO-SS28]|uniref:50S ribosomal protein L25/general stress protein Ctc n=1 Tax=Tepidicaulis sp. LMO-SS28 TaxID=3447455 RepID=UPI003EE1CCB9
MAEVRTLEAAARERAGKGAARAVRREGRIPAVIYGDKQAPELISLPKNEIERLWNTGTFMSHLVDIEVNGKKERAIPRDVQLDPVLDFVVHIDFLRLGKDATIDVEVPVHFVNEEASPGLKRGGVLNIVRHDVELSCPAEEIPEFIEIDVTGLEIGDSIHISSVKLAKGVKPTITDRDFTIATIAAPAGLVSSEAEAEEGEGGEEEKEEGGEE